MVVIVSSIFTLTSIGFLLLSTVPDFQARLGVSFSLAFFSILFQSIDEVDGDMFQAVEATFVGWFTLEYLTRLAVSPHKVTTTHPATGRLKPQGL